MIRIVVFISVVAASNPQTKHKIDTCFFATVVGGYEARHRVFYQHKSVDRVFFTDLYNAIWTAL
jgi:hypothetical protein